MSKNSAKTAWVWGLAFLAAAVVAASSVMDPLDRQIALYLAQFGRAFPAANLIWVFGGVPITGLVVSITAVIRGRSGWRFFLAFLGGLMVEVVCKHFIATPFPAATPEPAFYRSLELATNVTPHAAVAWIDQTLGIHAQGGAVGAALFRGSFPSGHVFRTTFAAGMLSGPRRPWATWVTALAAGFLVVSTGGHWMFDVVGGFLLARTCLAVALRFRTSR